MRSAVVGRKKDEVIAASDFLVKHLEEFRYLTVKFHVNVVILRSARAKGVPQSVSRRHADGQQVGNFVLSHLFVLQCGLGHLEGFGDTCHRILHLCTRLFADDFVLAPDPFGQLFHIICGRNEVACRLIPPVCRVSAETCRQYGGAVLEGNANHFRLIVGGNLQHVAYARGQKIVGRHLSLAAL